MASTPKLNVPDWAYDRLDMLRAYLFKILSLVELCKKEAGKADEEIPRDWGANLNEFFTDLDKKIRKLSKEKETTTKAIKELETLCFGSKNLNVLFSSPLL